MPSAWSLTGNAMRQPSTQAYLLTYQTSSRWKEPRARLGPTTNRSLDQSIYFLTQKLTTKLQRTKAIIESRLKLDTGEGEPPLTSAQNTKEKCTTFKVQNLEEFKKVCLW